MRALVLRGVWVFEGFEARRLVAGMARRGVYLLTAMGAGALLVICDAIEHVGVFLFFLSLKFLSLKQRLQQAKSFTD